jgi:hypothetical protein
VVGLLKNVEKFAFALKVPLLTFPEQLDVNMLTAWLVPAKAGGVISGDTNSEVNKLITTNEMSLFSFIYLPFTLIVTLTFWPGFNPVTVAVAEFLDGEAVGESHQA